MKIGCDFNFLPLFTATERSLNIFTQCRQKVKIFVPFVGTAKIIMFVLLFTE